MSACAFCVYPVKRRPGGQPKLLVCTVCADVVPVAVKPVSRERLNRKERHV